MKRWTAISANPNLPQVLASRANTLSSAHRSACDDRVAYLCDAVRGKRVLDVGVVNHMATTRTEPDWLHGHIAAAAGYCLGVDVLEEGISELQNAGYNVRCCDATSAGFEEQFDVIICGEIIHHLGHPGAMFENAYRTLVPGGRLILTTPNPFYVGRVLRQWFHRSMECADIVTLLFPSGVAELAERAGLQLTGYLGVRARPTTIKRKLLRPLRPMLDRLLAHDVACDTLIFECTKEAETLPRREDNRDAKSRSKRSARIVDHIMD